VENLRKRYYFEDLGVDGRIILELILKIYFRSYLPPDRNKWSAVVNTKMRGISRLAEEELAPQE
jgi:hypothetical protein